MSSEKHPNLGLHKWAANDAVKREEFNDNFAKVDSKTAEVATKVTSVEAAVGQAVTKAQVSAEVQAATAGISAQIADKASKAEVTAVTAQLAENKTVLGVTPDRTNTSTVWGELQGREYNVKWAGDVGGGVKDDTLKILEVINFSKSNGISKIIFPKSTYTINNLVINGLEKVQIDLKNSTLKGLSNVESELLSFTNNHDLELFNFKLDGNNTFYRGIRIKSDNSDLKIHSFEIINISPKIQSPPRNVNSVGIDLDITRNHNITFHNFTIDGVRNNDNGVIGDGIGSSRAILIQSLDQTDRSNSNIQFYDFEIKNVISEDGDGIQTSGSATTSVFMDVKFRDFIIDNCKRRGIKTQTSHGISFTDFKIRHSDRRFHMNAGISALSAGNSFKDFEVNIKGIKGVEYSPFQSTDLRTTFADFSVILENVPSLDGGLVVAIDLLNLETFNTINYLDVRNVFTLTPNVSLRVLTYTRNLKLLNANFNSYDKTKNGADFTFVPSTPASDGSMISHSNIEIDNVISDYFPVYFGNNQTTVKNSVVGSLQSRSAIDPYSTLVFKRTNVQTKTRQFRGDGIPQSGDFLLGDIMWNSNPTANGYIGWVCVVAGNPGNWKGFGLIQT